jgi:hypothetical protein
MTKPSSMDADGALLDLEGILHALNVLRHEGGLNGPAANSTR